MQTDPDASPFNAVSPVIVFLALAIFVVELAMSGSARGLLGGAEGVGWRVEAVQTYGFYGPVLDHMIETGRFSLADSARFVTYLFIHYSFTHTLFVLAFLLALGKLVSESVSPFAALAVFFASGIVGALAYAALTHDTRPLAGGFPAVYGLIGAFTFLMWARLGAIGAPQYQAFSLIAVLLGLQLLFGLLFGGTNDWVAEIAGFAVGFALTPLVAPGGFRLMLARIRDR